MSAPKFTPGPWRIKHSDKRRKVLACDVIDEEYRSVCSFFDSGRRDSTFANAHLCAAAPELYEALDDMVHGRDGAIERARAALGKAVSGG